MEDSHHLEQSSSDHQAASKLKKRRRSPEASRLHGSQPSPEHIGHMLMAAEAKPATHAKSARETIRLAKASAEQTEHRDPVSVAGKNVATISRAELLSLSEKVSIDGSSLRQIYETHLVGEHGLRRLMAEYIHGGDLKKALRREIIERQIDFERDPALRDMAMYPQSGISLGGTNSGKAALDKLLKQIDLNTDEHSEETAFFKARAIYEADQLQQHKQSRRTIDIGVAIVIAMLLALVLALYMNHA